MNLRSISFLMTCLVLVVAPDGSSMDARALLDNGSFVLFVSERLTQSPGLPHVHQNVHVSGIPGSSLRSSLQPVTSFQISAARHDGWKIELTAIVHCDLLVNSVLFELTWKHLSDIPLANPAVDQPG